MCTLAEKDGAGTGEGRCKELRTEARATQSGARTCFGLFSVLTRSALLLGLRKVDI